MEQRLSLVTLGVADLARSKEFYEAMGWHGQDQGEVVFFQTGSMVVGLWDRDQLASDSAVTDQGGWGGVTLAHNARSPEEVNSIIEEARAAGAVIGREPEATFWGGYSGVFLDPDGHPWEIAHNPFWEVTDDGATLIERTNP